MSGDQWYTNKDLFEMVQSLQRDIQATRIEMQETRVAVKQYNDLRRQLGQCQQDILSIKKKELGKHAVWDGIRLWGGWVVALAAFLYSILN